MDERLGLRERKKRRTRAALVAAAVRLFVERGYDKTTVADIAAEADVSPRTFFTYFKSKDDVLFADTDERIAVFQSAVTRSSPDDRPIDVLRRAFRQITTDGLPFGDDTAADRFALVLGHPDLRVSALRRVLAAERVLTEALRREFPDVDERDHVALVGAALGAHLAVALRAADREVTPERLADDLSHALDLLDRGFGA